MSYLQPSSNLFARVRSLAVAIAIIAAGFLVSAQGQVTYLYDAAGRLLAVVAPSGETAVYEYDSVGNLLSITRTPANTVGVLDFAPKAAPIGASVRIYGTAFSATSGQNSVTFNGVAATVVQATKTELLVSVPATATTGVIGVTSPDGSATSVSSFVVTAGTLAPEVTQFSPAIGLPATAVTIDGDNFQTDIAAKAALNITQFAVTSTAATSLSTSVPLGATSGRISVATPYGTATSTDDFYVPPSPYGPSDVSYTSRIPFDTLHVATISPATTIAMLLFDGVPGQRISLKAGPGMNSGIKIIEPNNLVLASVVYGGVINGFIDTRTLSLAGTYTIVADPTLSATGNLTLTLFDVPPDVTGTMTLGTGFPVTIGTPGQNARLTFTGTESHRVSLAASSGLSGSAISLRTPDGTVISSGTNTALGTFIEPAILPASGTYAVALDPNGLSTGTSTLTAYDVPDDLDGSITAGGPGVQVSITGPGQNAVLTFDGTAGQRVSLRRTNGLNSTVAIRRTDGSTQASATVGSAFNAFIETITLATTGTHSVLVDPAGAATGTATVTLYDVPADLAGTVTINGSSTAVSIGTPGQNGAYTFSGTASQQITVSVAGNTYGSVTVRLRRPDGTVVASSTSSSGSFNFAHTLPTTGTYTVDVDPANFNVGTLDLSVTNP
jgi:YD repeat-containing protein